MHCISLQWRRNDKVGLSFPQAAQNKLSKSSLCCSCSRTTEPQCCLWRQEGFSMLNYFHYAFSDAYWFYGRKQKTAAGSESSILCGRREQNAETMAQHKHKFALRSCFGEMLFTLFPLYSANKWTNKPPKTMNPSKLERLHQLREFIQSSVEVRYIPFYGTAPKQKRRLWWGWDCRFNFKILTF